MAQREVVTLPDPVLRRKTRKVTDFGSDLQTLVEDMVETMRAEPGVGLAAYQVGVSLRLLVVEYAEDESKGCPHKLFVVANPEFTRFRRDGDRHRGCLSIPDSGAA
jgi:peptide deformylase